MNIDREIIRKILIENVCIRNCKTGIKKFTDEITNKNELNLADRYWKGKSTLRCLSLQVIVIVSLILKQSAQWKLPILHAQKDFVSPNQESKNAADFLDIEEIVHYEFTQTGLAVDHCESAMWKSYTNFLTPIHLITCQCLWERFKIKTNHCVGMITCQCLWERCKIKTNHCVGIFSLFVGADPIWTSSQW